MSNAAKNLVASGKPKRVGPDYFGYYASEVVNLLLEDEDVLPDAVQTCKLPESKHGQEKNKSVNHSDNSSSSLYSNGVGIGLSDFKKDRLRSLLRQGVTTLSSEVDEVVDPVFTMYHLQSKLRSKTHSLNPTAIASNDVVEIPSKKMKISSSSSAACFHTQTNGVNPQCGKVDDLQFLMENDGVEVEQMVKEYSKELSETLGYMEKQLELILDAVMSKCRPMTPGEKQKLQRTIQKLPARNLDRVAQIICRSRSEEEQRCEKIFVDLEKEDNATLWRLYYYAEAVEKAKMLCCSEES